MADFENLIGQVFEVPAEEKGEVFTELNLREVARLPHGHPTRPEPFSLIFEGPVEGALDQGTYFLRHEAIGEHSMFLVPIGEESNSRCYQSIFN